MRTLILLLLSAALAQAATCLVVTTGVAFGAYNPVNGSASDSSGTITVTCTTLTLTTVSYTVTLGTGAGLSYTPRVMSSGANSLPYNLYTDSGRSLIWGSGSGGTSSVTHTSSLPIGTTVQIHTVYGRIPANQAVRAGSYSDSVVVTVTY